jgi:hypothetical protein
MKAFDWIVYMFLVCAVIALVPVLAPSYNNGNGLSAASTMMGSGSNWSTSFAQMQLSGAGSFSQALAGNTSLDPITYIFTLFGTFLLSAISILSMMFVSYPIIVSVFMIDSHIAVLLQVIISFIEIFGVYQIWRGNLIITEG